MTKSKAQPFLATPFGVTVLIVTVLIAILLGILMLTRGSAGAWVDYAAWILAGAAILIGIWGLIILISRRRP